MSADEHAPLMVHSERDPLAQLPPLFGDGMGNYRVHIVGNSGAGKSTLARELATILGVPSIFLDTLYFDPGWKECPLDEFRARVRAALDRNPRGWVVDGNYTSKIGGLVTDNATDVIWLDPPLLLYFPRLCWRTLLRLLGLEPQCSPGCDERLSNVFLSSDSIIWWCLSNHWVVRKRESERFAIDGIHLGGKRRRIGGWGGELDAWKEEVRAMVDARPHGDEGR